MNCRTTAEVKRDEDGRVGFLERVVLCPELGGNRNAGHADQRQELLASTVKPLFIDKESVPAFSIMPFSLHKENVTTLSSFRNYDATFRLHFPCTRRMPHFASIPQLRGPTSRTHRW